MSTQTYTGTLHVLECCNCGMVFGMTRDYERRKRSDHTAFYCPAGHRQYFNGESDKEKLQCQLDNERNRTNRLHGEVSEQMVIIRQKERQVAAHKGVATKRGKKLDRVANGMCPCCNRSFKNLERHMKGQHPNFRKDDDAMRTAKANQVTTRRNCYPR